MRKNFLRIASFMLALLLTLAVPVTALAADTGGDIPDDIPDDARCYITDENGNIIGYADGETGLAVWLDDRDQNAGSTETPVTEDTIMLGTFTDEELALVTKFKDVKSGAWYYSDVTECAKLGIVAGFEDGSFRPDDSVTAVQWVTMVTRTFYNADVEAAQKIKPSGTPWYWANTKVGTDKYLTSNMTINDSAMNRYDMANVAKNVIQTINNNVHAPSQASKDAVPSQVKDWSSVPKNRTVAIKVCYATGVIAGMSDGKFHGEQSMTRAQACTVIMRMLKLINKYNPGDKDNDQYDDGKNQDTGNQNQSGKLANGQPITEANVQTILDQIKRDWPKGTTWDANGSEGHYYADGHKAGTDIHGLWNMTGAGLYNTDFRYGCGGYAAMVSNRIFGSTGAPFREVTDIKNVRPGDVLVSYDKKNVVTHVMIALSVGEPYANKVLGGVMYNVTTTDGNANSKVTWDLSRGIWNNLGSANYNEYSGIYYRAFTRYPD